MTTDPTDPPGAEAYSRGLRHPDPAVVANALICLIHQVNFLLDRQITGLERQLVEGGGYSEQLAAARLRARRGQTGLAPARPPACPICGRLMVVRTARKGRHAGQGFWGCSGYPDCRGIRPIWPIRRIADRSDGLTPALHRPVAPRILRPVAPTA